MVYIFKGLNSQDQQYHSAIRRILKLEHAIVMPEPEFTDIYLYWCNSNHLAEGGVHLELDPVTMQYTLSHIALHIDPKAELTEQMGAEFFKAIYTELYSMVRTQEVSITSQQVESIQAITFPTLSNTQLTMELYGEALVDCINLGRWLCDEGEEFKEGFHRTILSLSDQDCQKYLDNLKNFINYV